MRLFCRDFCHFTHGNFFLRIFLAFFHGLSLSRSLTLPPSLCHVSCFIVSEWRHLYSIKAFDMHLYIIVLCFFHTRNFTQSNYCMAFMIAHFCWCDVFWMHQNVKHETKSYFFYSLSKVWIHSITVCLWKKKKKRFCSFQPRPYRIRIFLFKTN